MFRRILPVVAALAVLAGTVATADAARLTYRKARQSVACCDPCARPVPTVLCVQDPCCARVVRVNVCLPPCCVDEQPTVCCRRGLMGRPVMVYRWCCGYEVQVVFRLRGDVIVLH